LSSSTWLTVLGVAEALRVPVETVRRWIRSGDLPVLELGGSRTVYRIRRTDLERFLQDRYPGGSMNHRLSGTSDSNKEPQGSSVPSIDVVGIDSRMESQRDFIDRLPIVTFREATVSPGSPSFMSREIELLLGYSADDLLERTDSWREYIHPNDRAAVEAELARTDASGDPFIMDYRMVRSDGQDIWIRVEATLTDGDGPDGAVWEGVIVNITDLRAMQAGLHIRERQQQAIAELGKQSLELETLTGVLQEAVRQAAAGLDSSCVRVYEVLPGGKELALRANQCDESANGEHETTGSEDPLTVYALATRASVASEDLGSETRFDASSLFINANMGSGLATIIPGRLRPFGVITALFCARGVISQDDVDFVQSIASIVALAARQTEGSWYTVDEVADFLQVTDETVRRWVRKGELPALNLGGPRAGYRVYPTDLERFINDRLTTR
jgi:excisionase family DNA binding protein/PAS domain S-box-containing protein